MSIAACSVFCWRFWYLHLQRHSDTHTHCSVQDAAHQMRSHVLHTCIDWHLTLMMHGRPCPRISHANIYIYIYIKGGMWTCRMCLIHTDRIRGWFILLFDYCLAHLIFWRQIKALFVGKLSLIWKPLREKENVFPSRRPKKVVKYLFVM